MQKDWYWIVSLILFFIEREMIVDVLLMALYFVFKTFY